MDRLPTLTALLLSSLALGCGEDAGAKSAPQPNSRVVAVAAPKEKTDASEFCDVLSAADKAKGFSYPTLDTDPPKATGHWRWVNLWASWCAPCAEELPLITRFQEQLAKRGHTLDVVYISVDSSAEAADGFKASHPELKDSVRLKDFSALQAWLESVGLDAGATLPVHFFVDPAGKVRCARTGALRETDLSLVERVVSG